jgi:hypothetical protein
MTFVGDKAMRILYHVNIAALIYIMKYKIMLKIIKIQFVHFIEQK